MDRSMGTGLLAASAAGYPATQQVIRQFGRPGALLVALVCAGLFARDAALLGSGARTRLRPVPAALLAIECGVAAVAAGTTVDLLADPNPGAAAAAHPAPARERLRRGAVAALFGLHTIRFGIYLRPDHGCRTAEAAGRAE